MNACIRKGEVPKDDFAHEVLNRLREEKHGQPASYFSAKEKSILAEDSG